MPADPDQVTQLLREAGAGDPAAAERLVPMLYSELRRLAESQMRGLAPGQTLQPTALVHEAFVRLIGKEDAARTDADSGRPALWQNRFHFFFAASRAMHDILVENARAKATLKRGGVGGMAGAAARPRVNPDDLVVATDSNPFALLALSEVLDKLERHDPRKHQMVMLRFFAGLTAAQAAELMDIPLRTFERHWRSVRAWLHAELTGDAPASAPEGSADA